MTLKLNVRYRTVTIIHVHSGEGRDPPWEESFWPPPSRALLKKGRKRKISMPPNFWPFRLLSHYDVRHVNLRLDRIMPMKIYHKTPFIVLSIIIWSIGEKETVSQIYGKTVPFFLNIFEDGGRFVNGWSENLVFSNVNEWIRCLNCLWNI